MKSSEEKDNILKIFNLKKFNQHFDQNLVLLLTEPLSEQDLLPFDEEISIYEEFIKKYPNIIIKPHPREEKNYSKIFPMVKVLDSPFPVELLKYVGINIDTIITVCSTAALNFQNDAEIIIYDKKTSSDYINNLIKILKEKLIDL